MPIAFKKKVAVMTGHCEIEEAESLFAWLNEEASRQVNLKALVSAHTAVYQVLLAKKPKVSVWPESEKLIWLTKMMNNKSNVWCE
ncbi:hypothetical protein [Alteromonas macleodii]|uniref:Uncharacterized protein n=1 Tax=Alteromonas macleodii TaxID=28108 RepID=A0A6T9Y404_ALTMA|nr:hypothetical protein [Alteromonas macleodii]CAB9494971.1 conserved protein of unknown function [Alteromonas macleodii]